MEQNSPRPMFKSSFGSILILFSCLVLGSLGLMSLFQHGKTAAGGSVEMEKVMAMQPAQEIAESVPPEAPAPLQKRAYETGKIGIGNRVFVADIADTHELRELGLSGRQGLRDDEAMLFVFPTSAQNLFWMKDMLFSIDMIWLDKDKKVAHIAKNASPSSYPQTFGPSAPTLYVVEVRAGMADELGIRIGDKVRF